MESPVREVSNWKLAANERLRSAAEPLPSHAQVPFICECEDAECLGRVDVALGDYDEARIRGDAVRLAEHSREN
jgi:hypothetical protein